MDVKRKVQGVPIKPGAQIDGLSRDDHFIASAECSLLSTLNTSSFSRRVVASTDLSTNCCPKPGNACCPGSYRDIGSARSNAFN